MPGTNPYQAPQLKHVEIPVAKLDMPLASLWHRFAGSIIDTLILMPVFFAVSIPMFLLYAMMFNPNYFETIGTSFEDLIAETLVSLFSFLVSFLLLNGYVLSTRQQTIGKALMKTKIVGETTERVTFSRLFLVRYLLIWVVSMIPFVGGIFSLINVVSIFGEQRKCLHDYLARTRVVSLR